MQYEIRAYDALYDAKTRRIAYWDVCSDERHKTVETRDDAAYRFIDCINPDDDAVKTAWQYAKEYGETDKISRGVFQFAKWLSISAAAGIISSVS